jgi:hypothetical protein
MDVLRAIINCRVTQIDEAIDNGIDKLIAVDLYQKSGA